MKTKWLCVAFVGAMFAGALSAVDEFPDLQAEYHKAILALAKHQGDQIQAMAALDAAKAAVQADYQALNTVVGKADGECKRKNGAIDLERTNSQGVLSCKPNSAK
jgi:hypothetical protein